MKSPVLVIEDNPLNLELICELLEEIGCKAIAVTNAKAGLALARTERLALILMDVQLPGTDGYEATLQLKSDPRTAHIPVVAVTAHAMRGEAERARAAGCDAYLAKPVREEDFFPMVRGFLDRDDSARATPMPRARRAGGAHDGVNSGGRR